MRRTLSLDSRTTSVSSHKRTDIGRSSIHNSSEQSSSAVSRSGAVNSFQDLQQRGLRHKRYRIDHHHSSKMANTTTSGVGILAADLSSSGSHGSSTPVSSMMSSDRSISQAQSQVITMDSDVSVHNSETGVAHSGGASTATTNDSITLDNNLQSSLKMKKNDNMNNQHINLMNTTISDKLTMIFQWMRRIIRYQWFSIMNKRIFSTCINPNNSKGRLKSFQRLRIIDCFFMIFVLSVLFVGLSHNLILNRLLSSKHGSLFSSIINTKSSDSIMSTVPTYSLKNPNEYLFISGVPANITSLHHTITEDRINDMCKKIARSNSHVSYVVRDSRLYLTDVTLDKKKNKHTPHSLFIRSFSTFKDLSLSFRRTYRSAPRFSHDFDLVEQSMFSLSHPSIPDLSGLDACCHVLTLDGSSSHTSHHSRLYLNRNGGAESDSAHYQSSHSNRNRYKQSKDDDDDNDPMAGLPPLTVVINTWRREKCLLRVISHWSECRSVHKIVVVSADPKTEERWQSYPKLSRLLKNGQITVGGKRVDIHSATLGNDRLTDRFVFDPAIMSDVLLPIDDDIYYDCDFITDALRLYAALNMGKTVNDRTIAVGFEPRTFRLGYLDKSVRKSFDKHDSYFFVRERHNTCAYNAVWLTLGGILHKEYFLAFQSQRMMDVRASVNGNITAEDIAMSLLYSSMNHGMPPVALGMNPTQVKTLACTQSLSATMHSNKDRKRKDITFDAMRSLGLINRQNGLKTSSVFVTTEDHFRHQSLHHHTEESNNEFYKSRNPLDIF